MNKIRNRLTFIVTICISLCLMINFNDVDLNNSDVDTIKSITHPEALDYNIDYIHNSTSRSNSNRANWLDSFDDETKIESRQNVILGKGDVKLESQELFIINSTADFDAGIKNFVMTNTDNPSVPDGELHIAANNTVFSEGFEGVDGEDLDVYDPNWIVIEEVTNTLSSAKINSTYKYSGNCSVQFHSIDGLDRCRGQRTVGSYTSITLYARADGPSAPILILNSLSGDTVITSFHFWGWNIKYYDGGIWKDTDYDWELGVWYKIKVILDFSNQDFDVYIDGGAFNDFLIVDDASFRNPATSTDKIRIGNGDCWSEPVNPDSFTWYDNIQVDKFQYIATWESSNQTIQNNERLINNTISFYGLAYGMAEIEKIEWLCDGAVKAVYDTDIVFNSLSPFTITENDLTYGSFADIKSNFTVKIYLMSNGERTPKIKQIKGAVIYTNGTLTSNPVSIPTNKLWNLLSIDKTEPTDSFINISVLDASTNQTLNNYDEIGQSSIDLNSIDTIKTKTIKLKANFSIKGFESPTLHEWSLFFKPDPPKLTLNIPSNWSFLEDTDAYRLINLSNYFEDIWTPDNKLKYEIIVETNETHIDAIVNGTFLDFTTPTINWSGYERFKVKCIDEGGLYVNSNRFKVTVTEVNDPPVWSEIGPIHIKEDSKLKKIIELDNFIFDSDDILENISYSILSNANSDNIFVEIQNRIVYAKPLFENYYGETNIELQAYDGNKFAVTSCIIYVDPINDLPTVELLAPLNNTKINKTDNYDIDVPLSWNGGVDIDNSELFYDIYLDTVFPPKTLISNDQSSTSFKISLNDGTYYWKVIPNDGVSDGVCISGIWEFSIVTIIPPEIPPPTIALISPGNNSEINTSSVELYWSGNASYENLTYNIFLDTTPIPINLVASDITETRILCSNLTDGTTYYWFVIPVSREFGNGFCINGIWSFDIRLEFIPEYKVKLSGNDLLRINQSEKRYCNLTISNEGNVRDIYILNMDAEPIEDYLRIITMNNIMLESGNSSVLELLVSIPENSRTGEFNVTIKAYSFWGGKKINDTHSITIIIETESGVGGKPSYETGRWYDILVWIFCLVAIIILLIAIALFLQKRKREESQKAEDQEQGLDMDKLNLPAGPGSAAFGTATPVLTSTFGTVQASQAPIPNLAQPRDVPQLPQSLATQKLSNEEKLELLEEQLLLGEIDLKGYKELRNKLETGQPVHIPLVLPKLPPAQLEEVPVKKVNSTPSQPQQPITQLENESSP